MANPRRHHYVPQWLSKRWEQVDGKLLGVRYFDNQPVKGFIATRYAIGWTRNLYSNTNPDGSRDTSLETDFYSPLDSDLNTLTSSILNILNSGKMPKLSEDGRVFLAHYCIADARRRNPAYESHLLETTKDVKFKEGILLNLPSGVDKEKAGEIYDNIYENPVLRRKSVNKTRRIFYPKIAERYKHNDFMYLEASQGTSFILGDQPIIPFTGKQLGLGAYCFPISPKWCVAFTYNTLGCVKLAIKSAVRKINENSCENSNIIVSVSELHLRSLVGKTGKSLNFVSTSDRIDCTLKDND